MKTVKKIIDLLGGMESLATNPISLRVQGFMPLSIEIIGRGPHGLTLLSVMHHYLQNGDVMCDPDLEIEIQAAGDWLPISFRQDPGIFQVAVEELNGIVVQQADFVKQLRSFMRMWDKNIGDQGFVEAAIQKVTLKVPSQGGNRPTNPAEE